MPIEEIRRIAKEENISVFGVGPTSEMADEPAGHRPVDFLPGAQSLICFGIPIPHDVYRTPEYNLETAWRSQNLLYRRLDTLALRLSILLEESGARALPIYGCMPLAYFGIKIFSLQRPSHESSEKDILSPIIGGNHGVSLFLDRAGHSAGHYLFHIMYRVTDRFYWAPVPKMPACRLPQ
jgi:hypothetical protein